jgi:hypothetical protein
VEPKGLISALRWQSLAYARAEAESQPWLFNHVVRSWLYGAKLT